MVNWLLTIVDQLAANGMESGGSGGPSPMYGSVTKQARAFLSMAWRDR